MKGICFKEPLFHETVEGRKTQTRRIMNIQPPTFGGYKWKVAQMVESTSKDDKKNELKLHWVALSDDGLSFDQYDKRYFLPRYRVGEKVYLKEPYSIASNFIAYKYENICSSSALVKWENKLFMPKRYARYFIEITAVRCERLQDISDEDCLKEGIEHLTWTYANGSTVDIYSAAINTVSETTPREAYAALIDKINGKGTWESNPFVWVYDYKLVK